MKARLLLASIGFMSIALFALAQQTTTQPKTGAPDTGEIITSEQQLARMFSEFQDALLRLKQRLARGTPEEKRRAEVLDKVIDECKNLAINQEFSKMIQILREAKFTTTTDAIKAKEQSALLADRLKRIYEMMQDRSLDLSKDREQLQKIIQDIQKAIDLQRAAQGQTDRNKTDKDELGQIQQGVNKKTAEIAKNIDKYLKKDGKAGEAANLKGENKDPGKSEGSKGESKNDGKEQKKADRGEAKQGGPDDKGAKGEAKPGQDSKSGSPKDGGEKKSGAKSGDKSGKEGKEGSAKEGKSGDKGKEGSAKSNSGEKSPMKGEGKEGSAKSGGDKKDGQQGAAKAGGDDKKAGDEKGPQGKPDSQAKAGQPDAKQGGAKDSKAGKEASQAKAGDAKPSDKGGDGKQGDAKPGDSKAGKGQAKDGGAPPMDGQQAGQPQQKGGDQPQANNPPGDKQDQDVQQSKKKVVEAGYDQKAATDNIKKGDNKQASNKQGEAIKNLEDAKKKLEKLLQQMREDEIERVLAALENRCVKMLEMQKQVLRGTEDTDRAILKNADKKPSRDNKRDALALADKQKEIVQECNKCITILESEGSAVAFPEVFQQIRQDMIHVQKRLELTDVADVTQGIERDIIDTLKEMIDALKKAQEDNKSDSKPGKSGKAGKPGDKKLLELIQELKMVRSLQKRVNDRTVGYAKRFPGQEQTRDPQTVVELRNLAERQLRIQEIVSRIAKGENK